MLIIAGFLTNYFNDLEFGIFYEKSELKSSFSPHTLF